MNRIYRLLLAVFLLLAAATGQTALGQERPELPGGAGQPGNPPHAQGHVLVKLSGQAQATAVVGPGTESVFDTWRLVPVPHGRQPWEVAAELAARPGVELAELDYLVQLDPEFSAVPLGHASPMSVNDPLFQLQWHFPLVQAADAWAHSTGSGVVVAVVDTGITQGGEDLDCHSFVAPYNAITDTAGSSVADDDHGHGTHVAGTVAQCTNNGVGVAGIAFDASLMPVKALNSSGSGTMSTVARGVNWARTNGAEVINLSLGCDGCTSSMLNQAIESAAAEGIVLVAASGNSNSSSVAYPASHPDVIAVGAVDFNRKRAPYSNRGAALDLVAPGGDLSQDANGDGHPDGVLQETFEAEGSKEFGYFFSHGTSMAAPHVSGAVALLLSFSPDMDRVVVQTVLESTALDLGPSGHDTEYGHGLIQIHDALEYLATAPTWPATAELTVKTYGETQLTLAWSGGTDPIGITGYLLRRVGTAGTEVSARSATVSGLDPGSPYQFEVLARNVAGNWSEPLSSTVRTSRFFFDTVDHIFYQDVLWLSGNDITRGCSPPQNDLFCTDDGVTREAMAAFLVRALGLTENTHPGFVDVLAGSTFASDIGRLATAGITRGCNPPQNDRFCPTDMVTRGQMAAFLNRALG